MMEGSIPLGTAFFVNAKGNLITCWHVVESAILNKKKVLIEFSNGRTIEVFAVNFNSDTAYAKNRVFYDFCILSPVDLIKNQPFLKIGNFDTIKEGEEIYTCGYPLGNSLRFISKGIISTKYVNREQALRNEALLDLTLNAGNSGGAIVRVGKSSAEDEVIGIADFILPPVNTNDIVEFLKPGIGGGQLNRRVDSAGNVVSSYDPNAIAVYLLRIIGSLPTGVSGCVSINYVSNYLKALEH
jgi:serine protease Do